MPRKVITEELKQEIIKYYLSQPMTMKQVEDKYELSHPTMTKILKDVPKYTKAKLNNPDMKEHFFQEIDEEAKAYFLGLLISDGNVFKDNTGRQASISITLDLKDEYMLEKFKEVLQANTSIGHDGRGCGQMAVRSNIMAEDLAKYGVVPQKTSISEMPVLSTDMMPHLIRGMIDGDGWISFNSHQIGFCGNEKTVNQLKDYLVKTLNVYDVKVIHASENLWQITWASQKDIEKIGNYIYQNKDNCFLSRKYNNFLQIIHGNTEVNS